MRSFCRILQPHPSAVIHSFLSQPRFIQLMQRNNEYLIGRILIARFFWLQIDIFLTCIHWLPIDIISNNAKLSNSLSMHAKHYTTGDTIYKCTIIHLRAFKFETSSEWIAPVHVLSRFCYNYDFYVFHYTRGHLLKYEQFLWSNIIETLQIGGTLYNESQCGLRFAQ